MYFTLEMIEWHVKYQWVRFDSPVAYNQCVALMWSPIVLSCIFPIPIFGLRVAFSGQRCMTIVLFYHIPMHQEVRSCQIKWVSYRYVHDYDYLVRLCVCVCVCVLFNWSCQCNSIHKRLQQQQNIIIRKIRNQKDPYTMGHRRKLSSICYSVLVYSIYLEVSNKQYCYKEIYLFQS